MLDEEFTQLMLQVHRHDPKLIAMNEGFDYQQLEDIVPDLINQVKSLASAVLEKKSFRAELGSVISGNRTFGKQNDKIDLRDFFQTLEEGFESADNLVSSCEVLQFIDYQCDIKRFLGIEQPNSYSDLMSLNQMYEKVLNWMAVSNRIKDKSVAVLAGAEGQSFFESLLVIEERVQTFQQKLEYLNNGKDELTYLTQQNEKLSSDIEELLEEFADLKKKYQGMGEELRRAEGEVAEFRRMNTFLDLQVKKLKEEKDFAEAPEEIERLNTLLVERDIAIEKIKQRQSQVAKSIITLWSQAYGNSDHKSDDQDTLLALLEQVKDHLSQRQTKTQSSPAKLSNSEVPLIREVQELLGSASKGRPESLHRLNSKLSELETALMSPSSRVAQLFNSRESLKGLPMQRQKMDEICVTLDSIAKRMDNAMLRREIDELITYLSDGGQGPNESHLQRKLQRQQQYQMEMELDFKRVRDERDLHLLKVDQYAQQIGKLELLLSQNEQEARQNKEQLKEQGKLIAQVKQEIELRNQQLEESQHRYQVLEVTHEKVTQHQSNETKTLHVKWERYMDMMKGENERALQTLQERERELQEMSRAIHDLQKQVHQLEFQLQLSKEQQAAHTKEYSQSQDSLAKQLERKCEEIADLEHIVQSLTNVNRDNQNQINSMRSKFELIAKKLQESDAYTNITEQTSEQQRLVIEDLQDRLRRTETENDDLLRSNSDFKSQLDTLRLRSENAARQASTSISKLNSTVTQLSSNLEEKQYQLTELKHSTEQAQSRIKDKDTQIEQQQTMVGKLKQQLGQTNDEAASLHRLVNELQCEIESQQTRNDILTQDLQRNLQKLKDQQEQLENQRHDNMQLQKLLAETMAHFQEETQQQNESINQFEILNQQLQESLDLKEITIEGLQRRIVQHQQEIQLYEKRLDEMHLVKEQNKRYLEGTLYSSEETMKLKEHNSMLQQRYNELDRYLKSQAKELETLRQQQQRSHQHEKHDLDSSRHPSAVGSVQRSFQEPNNNEVGFPEVVRKQQEEIERLNDIVRNFKNRIMPAEKLQRKL